MLNACASMVSGPRQKLLIKTDPVGAECNLYIHGLPVGHVASTPASIEVERQASDLVIGCVKEGYDLTPLTAKPSLNSWVIGNILFGGIIGVAVDFSTGSGFEYVDNPSLGLIPLGEGVKQPSLPITYHG